MPHRPQLWRSRFTSPDRMPWICLTAVGGATNPELSFSLRGTLEHQSGVRSGLARAGQNAHDQKFLSIECSNKFLWSILFRGDRFKFCPLSGTAMDSAGMPSLRDSPTIVRCLPRISSVAIKYHCSAVKFDYGLTPTRTTLADKPSCTIASTSERACHEVTSSAKGKSLPDSAKN